MKLTENGVLVLSVGDATNLHQIINYAVEAGDGNLSVVARESDSSPEPTPVGPRPPAPQPEPDYPDLVVEFELVQGQTKEFIVKDVSGRKFSLYLKGDYDAPPFEYVKVQRVDSPRKYGMFSTSEWGDEFEMVAEELYVPSRGQAHFRVKSGYHVNSGRVRFVFDGGELVQEPE